MSLTELERLAARIAVEKLKPRRLDDLLSQRMIEDLNCDSLEYADFIMELEDASGISLPEAPSDPIYKTVFTRQPFRLRDVAELFYLKQSANAPKRQAPGAIDALKPNAGVSFTQLGGVWQRIDRDSILEKLKSDFGFAQFRRRSDGMRCVQIPAGDVTLGCNNSESVPDERPQHAVKIDSFLIDAELVSTTAYCRFLNSIGKDAESSYPEWFALDPHDPRHCHVLIEFKNSEWQPIRGTERWPMILVSWFGAHAYSHWANGEDWRNAGETNEGSFLPSEAQWEYAARGAEYRSFPWGSAATHELMRFGQHRKSATYDIATLPLADVNAPLGLSPFGLHHMAGNVWQWCRDWYAESFYSSNESRQANPINRTPSLTRSERGGSWIGPAELCRSSYRRGRPPSARGRCLGFRCISPLSQQ